VKAASPRFRIGGERIELRGRRRKTDEIEAGAAEPRLGRGGGGRGEFFGFETGENEVVEGGARPFRGVGLGQRGADRRDEGPVLFVGRTLGDPAAEEGDLFGRDVFVGVGRGHLLFGVLREQAEDELALFGFAGGDDEAAVALGDGVVAFVEAELGLAVVGVLAVAVETVFREDGADVAVELELGGRGGAGSGGEQGGQEETGGGEAGHRGGVRRRGKLRAREQRLLRRCRCKREVRCGAKISGGDRERSRRFTRAFRSATVLSPLAYRRRFA